MKKVVSTIALFIFSFPAFCATTLDLPYIIKYQKMGEHGYCFVSRTKDDLSKINEAAKSIIICYTDLNLKVLNQKQIALEDRIADEDNVNIICNDSIFLVIVSNEQNFKNTASQVYAFELSSGKQIAQKTFKDVFVRFYPVCKSNDNSEMGFIAVSYSIADEYNLTVASLTSTFKTNWTKQFHIENMNKHFVSSLLFSTANAFGDKVYFNYHFDKYKGFRLLDKVFTISCIDLKNGTVENSKTYPCKAKTEKASVMGTPDDIWFNTFYNPKFPITGIVDSTYFKVALINKASDDLISGYSITKFGLDNIDAVEENTTNGVKEEFFKKNFSTLKFNDDSKNLVGGVIAMFRPILNFPRQTLDVIDDQLYSLNYIEVKKNESKNNRVIILRKIDLNSLKTVKTVSFQSNSGLTNEVTPLGNSGIGPNGVLPTFSDALNRKKWHSFFKALTTGETLSSEVFNTKTISFSYHLIWKDKSENNWLVFPDWNEAKALPFVKAYNLETKSMKTLEWNPSFSNDESKIVQANILEGTDGNVLLYEIDEKGKAHFHFEATKQ